MAAHPQTSAGGLPALPGQVSLTALPGMAWKRRWLVLGITVLSVALGAAFLSLATPLFEVQARVLVEREGMPLEQVSDAARWDKEFLATQAEIVRSPAVVQRAVKEQGLKAPGNSEGDPAALILARLRVAPVLGTHVLSIKFDSPDAQEAQRTVNSILTSYREYLRERDRDTQSETIQLLTRNEKELRDDLARLAKEYQELRQASPLLGGQGRDAASFHLTTLSKLGETLQQITSRRLELENLLPLMQQASELVDRPLRSGAPGVVPVSLLTDEGGGNIERTVPTLGLLEAGTLLPRFSQQASLPHDVVTMQEELSRARAAEQQLSANYGPKHPDIRSAREQVLAWERRLYEHVKSAPGALKQELAALKQHEEQLNKLYEAELAKAKDVDGHLIREQQSLDAIQRTQAVHSSLLTQLQQWQLAEQAAAQGRLRINVTVLEEPVVPLKPAWPSPLLVLAVCAVFGVCASMGLIVLSEVQTPRSVVTVVQPQS